VIRDALRGSPTGVEADPEARRALLEQGAIATGLEQGAIATGERWADRCREALRQQGRRASGGWPGTVTEARALVSAHFAAELGPLTYDELQSAAKLSYTRAKRQWLAREAADS
jgi:hypothetical protein